LKLFGQQATGVSENGKNVSQKFLHRLQS